MIKNKGVYIPFDEHKYVGGPPTFLRNLNKFLKKKNYKFSDSLFDAKILFFPISFNIFTIYKFKIFGGKVVQRLDGIHYFQHDGPRYKRENGYLGDIYKYFADYVVFQSDYSMKQCFSALGKTPRKKYKVIVNGVDKTIFYPKQMRRRKNKENFNLVTTGNFTRSDMLEPIIQAVDLLTKNNSYQINLHIVGPVAKEMKKFLKRVYVSYQGTLDPKEIGNLLRKCDIFVYAKMNPPCPNSVIEAVSTGIPVVGFKSGAMEELLPFSKDLLAYVSEDTFQKQGDFDHVKLASMITKCLGKLEYYTKRAKDNSYRYSMEECANKYSEVFDLVNQMPTQKYKIPTNTVYFVIHLINKLFKWRISL